MNKDTLRTQFDAIKNNVQLLKAEGKLSSEALVLMQSMISLFEIMIAVFLEKAVKKNTKNSSIPSSQVEKDNSAIKHGSNTKGREGYGRASNSRKSPPKKLGQLSIAQLVVLICATHQLTQ